MLIPEQVIQFLQHNDPMVRNQVLNYFRDSYNFGPLTAEHFWPVIDRFGENAGTIGFASRLGNLPQTPASLDRLIRAIESQPPEDFDYHYQHAARQVDLPLLERGGRRLLESPQLLDHVRRHLELRLSLIHEPPEKAFDRLMQHARELDGKYEGEYDASLSEALIEVSARGGEAVCRKAMELLDEPDVIEDWRSNFAMRVVGAARFEPAIDRLIPLLLIDSDICVDVTRALARIGTPRVAEQIVAFYPGKPWHTRIYAHAPLSSVKRPESEAGLLRCLEIEQAIEAHPEDESLLEIILQDFPDLGSLAALDESRRCIAERPNDVEMTALCRDLLATAIMNGVALPEETQWRQRFEAYQQRVNATILSQNDFSREMRRRWRDTGIRFKPSDPGAEQDWDAPPQPKAFLDDYGEQVQTIRNSGPKIGRNDRCPCGSGKKFKKCCGNS